MKDFLIKYHLIIIVVFITAYSAALASLLLQSDFLLAGIIMAIPFLIGGFYLAINDFKVLFGAMVFSLPLSLNFRDLGGFGLSIPGELIVVFVAGVGLMRIIWNLEIYKPYFNHWLSKIILLHVVWMFFTVLTSSMTVVSLKFFVIRFVYVLVFFFLATEFFEKVKKKGSFLWLYAVAMLLPIAWSVIRHSENDFSQASSYDVGDPFYNDHTIYAACLAMIIPVFVLEVFNKERTKQGNLLAFLMLLVLSAAILLSYSRAGWGSLAVALVCGVAIKIGVNFRLGVAVLLLGLGLVFFNGHKILSKIKENDTQSSEGFLNHASSVSNISTDNSNMERINRWACGLRMFKKRPIQGFGPGTYPFQYGQFQRSSEMTWVSVRDGSVGGVHSEYLKPLAEMGGVGFVLFMAIVFGGIKLGIELVQDVDLKTDKKVVFGMLLGFITYLVHGVVNFFLDTDKSSVLFWGFLAMMVVADVARKKNQEEKNTIN